MSRIIHALRAARWSAARLMFHAYVVFSLVTVVGGFLTAPLMTWYFLGTWKFWRHRDITLRLFLHGWKMAGLIAKESEGGFMLDVPLASAPHSAPVPSLVRLNPRWEHGRSCGSCSQCCEKIACPILDRETGLCRGYDSFFWRYFNCGRFPSAQREIDYYGCPKWEMQRQPSPRGAGSGRPAPDGSPEPATEPALRTE
jgi:hypothetical protein